MAQQRQTATPKIYFSAIDSASMLKNCYALSKQY